MERIKYLMYHLLDIYSLLFLFSSSLSCVYPRIHFFSSPESFNYLKSLHDMALLDGWKEEEREICNVPVKIFILSHRNGNGWAACLPCLPHGENGHKNKENSKINYRIITKECQHDIEINFLSLLLSLFHPIHENARIKNIIK